MPQQKGRTLLIKIGNDDADPGPETFSNLCGLTTRSFSMSANDVDTTIPDCNNPGGPVIKTGEPGIQSRTFSGNGKFVSGANSKKLLDHVRAGEVFNAQIIVPGDGTYTGPWYVTDWEFSGEMEGNMDFSATFNPASPPAFVAEV